MSSNDRRQEIRTTPGLRFNPISCVLISQEEKIPLEIVNFHYRGACFKVAVGDYRVQQNESYLNFKIGTKDLPERIFYRIVWETIADNGLFGVEFSTESKYVLSRAERFFTHSVNAPVISSQDPLDPNRIIYFKAINVSTTGMLLSTSLSNKHLFPGMELRCAILEIPGIGKTDVDLFIENSRPVENGNAVHYGVSVKGASHNYHDLISKYLSNLGLAQNPEERLDKLSASGLVSKSLSKHLTIREIKTEKEYEQILKLRFDGYQRAGKIKDGTTFKDMGDGLEKEGIVLGAYLGGQLVATCEFRFNRIHGLRLSERFDVLSLPEVRSDNIAEINKLVVHPRAQKTDIVLGIFQKIHALAMLNGRPDGLIAAEDKLVSLYKRLGFHQNGISYPHPTKPGIKLHLMIMPSEAYASSKGMNAYAWHVAFNETQKFYDEIGIYKTESFTLKGQFQKVATPIALKILELLSFKKKKKKDLLTETSSHQQQQEKRRSTRTVADPRWTRQEVNATIMLPYILEAEDMIGKEKVTKILISHDLNLEYFKSVSNWISIEFFNSFLEEFGKTGNTKELNRRAAYRAASKEILGANYYVIKHLGSPNLFFKTFEKQLQKFNKTRTLKVTDSGRNFCRIRILNLDRALLPKDSSTRDHWVALIDAYIQIQTGKPAQIEVLKSSFDGDQYCEYHIQWKSKFLTIKTIATTASGVFTAFLAWVYLGHFIQTSKGQILTMAVTLVGCVSFLSYLYFVMKRRYLDMVEALSQFEKDADERYRELQSSKSILEKSYQEGKLLETMNREIQVSEDLSNIFDIALNSLCTKFSFKRAFVMILDSEGKYLRTAAVHSGDHAIPEIWNYKVDISVKRENPLVLSSVFHTGQSILVSNIDEHKFQLNETSRRLIESIGTKGFAMVPIPANEKNWGVMIADKGKLSEVITRRDLVALQRIAQSIGMALDKKAKIDEEIKVRNIFQKFVPSAVIENTLGNKEAKLGGETKQAICLFMDIRDFTKLSNTLPSQLTVDILNKLFDILQKTVRESGGVIDKFLGDGALVTWGAVPGSEAKPEVAIAAAELFIKRLEILSSELKFSGLPELKVGLGIHQGPVIAGNIGTNDRMEFTVIGQTVNIASRLEGLTKMLNSSIVISESLIPFIHLKEDWKIHNEVQVRGLETAITVATYKKSSLSTPSSRSESA